MAYTGSPKALGFFGSILSSAFQGATTSEVWSNLKEAATNTAAGMLGVPQSLAQYGTAVSDLASQLLSGISVTDVSQLRGIAGQQIAAMGNLANADRTFAVDASMIGPTPNSITGPGTGFPQQYYARIGYTGTDVNGNEVSGFTTIGDIDVSGSVGDVFDQLYTEAQARVESGSDTPPILTLTSIDSIALLEL